MSNSGLVDVVVKASSNTLYGPRNRNIDLITIHCMAGSLTAKGCGDWFASGNASGSSNYGVGSDGKVGLYADESIACHTSSNSTNDHRAVTIETADNGQEPEHHVDDKVMAKLVLLCADICRRNGIKELKFDPSDSSHPTTPNGNMTLHRWFSAKSCPGDYLVRNMSKIASEVNKLLESGDTTYSWNGSVADGSGMATEMSTGTTTGQASINIDVSQLTPYVVTVDPSVTKINYKKLKKLQVSGMMFEAGFLYDKTTHEETVYQNKNLLKQVTACNEAELKFALYAIVRARNVKEAQEECKYLWYVVSKFPPGMGIWLKLEFQKGQTKKKNNKILDCYLEYLEKWGLKDGCGIYCNKKMIERIDWDTYQDKFLLWYMNMFTDESEFDQVKDKLITPNFFQLDPTDPGTVNAGDGSSSADTTNASSNLGSGTGADVVRYARQFIGNPYVWGGTSLTNGCDCSGFTMRIFEHFGISLPHSSSSQRNYGTAVDVNNAQAGDLVCYSGHVGICNGSGGLVHASNRKDGIKESSTYKYKTVVAVRRLV